MHQSEALTAREVSRIEAALQGDRQPIITLSWATIHEGVECLEQMIKPFKPHLLVAIARGGLIPATLLSHRLNCPLEVIHASSYEGTRRTLQKPTHVTGWKEEYNTPNTIVIDDIMDTGKTWDALLYGDGRLGINMRAKLATLVKKTGAIFPNFNTYFIQVPPEVWVKFPWEQDI